MIIEKRQSFQVSLLHEPSFRLLKTLSKQSCFPFSAHHYISRRRIHILFSFEQNPNWCLVRRKLLISKLSFRKKRPFTFLSYLIHTPIFFSWSHSSVICRVYFCKWQLSLKKYHIVISRFAFYFWTTGSAIKQTRKLWLICSSSHFKFRFFTNLPSGCQEC